MTVQALSTGSLIGQGPQNSYRKIDRRNGGTK